MYNHDCWNKQQFLLLLFFLVCRAREGTLPAFCKEGIILAQSWVMGYEVRRTVNAQKPIFWYEKHQKKEIIFRIIDI